jgi:hypothetical protein
MQKSTSGKLCNNTFTQYTKGQKKRKRVKKTEQDDGILKKEIKKNSTETSYFINITRITERIKSCQPIADRNKTGEVHSLEYTHIPKVFFMPHHTGHCCTTSNNLRSFQH